VRAGRFLSGIALVCLVACSRHLDPVERATREIRRADIQDYGERLSSDAMAGRRHASPEADSVVSYLVGVLGNMGIEPRSSARELFAGAPACFEHYFDVTLSRLGRRTRLSAVCDGRAYHWRTGDGYLPLVFSSEGDVTGPPTRLDHAAQLWDGDGERWRGRVVRVGRDAIRRGADESVDAALYHAASRLTELGAAAVLFEGIDAWERQPCTTYPAHLSRAVLEHLATPRARQQHWNRERYATLQQSRVWQVAARRTIPAVVLAPDVARVTAECTEVRVRVAFDHEVSLGRNVLVVFPGSQRPNRPILLTAHYDQAGITDRGDIIVGAHDNASGVAALLATASALFRVRAELEHDVVLAFVGAELLGGLGTETLRRDWPRLLATGPPQVCFGVEAVGLRGPDLTQIVGAVEDGGALRWFESVNARATLDAAALVLEPKAFRPPAAGLEFAPGPHVYSLAHWSAAGVPSWTLYDDVDADPRQDAGWGAVDPGKVARVARLLFRTTYAVSTRGTATAVPAALRP